MSVSIEIEVGGLILQGELAATGCAGAIVESLPLETSFNTWGEEFYFEIPVICEADETATIDVEVGTIGYWPPGRALAIFFGRTPMSTTDKPVPASEVNLVGRLEDAEKLVDFMSEDRIIVRRVE
ncbi:MAG: cyclophilin-like fold protein [Planctomycetes bacterium]|nr:cyclophilin-like fold protein [Planctomycetota bacterium]